MYWTAVTAGGSRADELLDYMLKSGLNTAVIDLKFDNGEIAFIPQDETLRPYASDKPTINDLHGLLAKLKEKNIYRIARLAVMRDTAFATRHPDHAMKTSSGALWRDKTGIAWADPASPLVGDLALALAREAKKAGFDEIQFDYVRFASDGAISNIRFTQYNGKKKKTEVMRDFFEKMGKLRDEGIRVSFDLFGMTYLTTDDFGIGQRLEDVYPFADFISPMTYPSHYWPNFLGFKNPAEHPYEVVKHTIDTGVTNLKTDRFIEEEASRYKTRPWIQDFDLGAPYPAAKIEAQIKAARDAGSSGWMLWNARNVYKTADYLTGAPDQTAD